MRRSPFPSACLRVVAIVCATAAAFAQDPAAETPESGQASIEDRLAALEQKLPVDVSIAGTTTYQTTTGAQRNSDYLVGYLDMVAEGELWPGTTAVLELESIGGDGPDADTPSFGSLWYGWNGNGGSAQDADGFDRVYLGEAFVSTSSICADWVVDLGKIASTSYLDTIRVANDSTTQFLSGAFSNATAFEAPWRGAGVAASYVGSSQFDVRLLAMRPDNMGRDATRDLFIGGQAGLYWGQESLPGTCSVYVWSNGANDDQAGIGLNLDQDVNERITAFGRVAAQEEESTLPQSMANSWSLGFELRQGFCGKDCDTFGLALGLNESHDDTLDEETVYEAYYKRAFNEHCEASFHVQGMNHPAGDPNEDQVTAFGLRLLVLL